MLLLLLLLLLLLTAPGQSGSQPAAAMCDPRTGLSRPVARCGPPAPPPQCRGGGELRHAFDGTVLRQYCLHAPPSPPPPTAAGSPPKQAPLPLLVYLHDEGEGVDQIYRHTSLPRQAETFALSPGLRGFVLALPQAGALRPPAAAPAGACATGWDYWHRNFSTGRACADCPMGNLSTNADIAFVDRVVDAAVSSGRVDPTKVFVGGWGAGGFFAQMYGAARARDAGSAQPSGTCVAAAAVYSAADPFSGIRSRDDGCALRPYPNASVATLIASHSCDSVCCDAAQPDCPSLGTPGWDVSRWVADAQQKMGLRIDWQLLLNSSSSPASAASGPPVAHPSARAASGGSSSASATVDHALRSGRQGCATQVSQPACTATEAVANHGRWPGAVSAAASVPVPRVCLALQLRRFDN